MFSLIIPTYNERENISVLLKRLESVFRAKRINSEIIVVDDNSPDGTAEIVKELAKKYGNIKIVERTGKLGLSSAVITGFKVARGDVLGVMDADFSHPPEKIPEMIQVIRNGEAELVVGSRYVHGGRIKNWPILRKITSAGAVLLAKPLTPVKDPVSGFFVLKGSVIKNANLNPKGYKIGLEIIVKGNYKKIKEVPFVFVNRKRGKTKINFMEYSNYIMNLLELCAYRLGWKE